MNSKLIFLTLAVFALTANSAVAKKTTKSGKTATEVYTIDTQASSIEWSGSKPTATHHGTIAIKDGQLEVKNKEIKGGQFSVQMDTLADQDLAGNLEYKNKLETHLKSEDFFNVEKYPQSTFKIKSIKQKTDSEITIKGDLTMVGKTQEIEFPANVKMEEGKMSGTADIKIDRTKWDLRYGSGKFFKNLGDKLISDEINLKLNLVAKK